MSEQDTVERAARASYARMAEIIAITRPGGDFIVWEALPEEQRRIMLASQRAAIEAMREPTPEMIDASSGALKAYIDALPAEERGKLRPRKGRDGGWHGYKVAPQIKAALRWRAMIDKALESK